MNRIDVVVPCYNYGRYLSRAVASVLDQPGVDPRVLVIDDCSSDDSESVGRALSAADSRVEFRRHAENRGHIATYNEGLLGWAEGDYVLLLSADDALAPGALARATRALGAHPNAGLCYGRQQVFSDEEPPPFQPPAESCAYEVVTGEAFMRSSCRAGSNLVPTPTAVVRTSLQRLVGPYRAELPHTADLDMWLRLSGHAAVISLDGVQAFKRMHATNMQHQYVATLLPDLQQRAAAFEMALGGWAGRPGAADEPLQWARRALASEAFWAASRAFDDGQPHQCADLLACAVRFDPALRMDPAFARLAWKRRLGHAAWSLAAPLVRAARRLAGRPARTGPPPDRVASLMER
jgi:glycosyltransferase involved in cell wall biosynthesis